MTAVEIKVTGDAFRTKVRQALDLWVKLYPAEARSFVREAKERMGRGEGDKDLKPSMRMPARVVEWLRQTEFATLMQFRVPCGTGDRLWDSRQELQDIFLQEMPESQLSRRRGAPKKRGWA